MIFHISDSRIHEIHEFKHVQTLTRGGFIPAAQMATQLPRVQVVVLKLQAGNLGAAPYAAGNALGETW